MLALKVVFQSQQGIDTIIFDEIDTGVSGKVAYAMGHKMKHYQKIIKFYVLRILPVSLPGPIIIIVWQRIAKAIQL